MILKKYFTKTWKSSFWKQDFIEKIFWVNTKCHDSLGIAAKLIFTY